MGWAIRDFEELPILGRKFGWGGPGGWRQPQSWSVAWMKSLVSGQTS